MHYTHKLNMVTAHWCMVTCSIIEFFRILRNFQVSHNISFEKKVEFDSMLNKIKYQILYVG